MALVNFQEAQTYLEFLPLLHDLPKQPFFIVYDQVLTGGVVKKSTAIINTCWSLFNSSTLSGPPRPLNWLGARYGS
ncbi:hypothetical protein [Halomicronema sp. CCY15110]|uniref:hypothetical protein n=1 Tax=Halomicronema sp. CCY15110 TaxID=2767773 RepID=UPI0019528FD4|nr:hypothetical protein [Halomicronema sp. CCY15110]